MGLRTIENVDERAHLLDKPTAERLRDPEQKFCVLSIVAPMGTNQKAKDCMIKVYGCKSTLDEANDWALRLRDANDFLDVYVLKCHAFALMPPQLDKIDNVQSTDSRIQSIRDSYIDHLKGDKAAMIERLDEVELIRKKEEKEKSDLKRERSKYFEADGTTLRKGKTLPAHLIKDGVKEEKKD